MQVRHAALPRRTRTDGRGLGISTLSGASARLTEFHVSRVATNNTAIILNSAHHTFESVNSGGASGSCFGSFGDEHHRLPLGFAAAVRLPYRWNTVCEGRDLEATWMWMWRSPRTEKYEVTRNFGFMIKPKAAAMEYTCAPRCPQSKSRKCGSQ